MEIIMAKKVKFGFGKRTKRMKADKRRENEQAETHSHPGNKESGDVTSRMAMALLCASEGLRVVPVHAVIVHLR
jgi:hypothetical protein